MTLYALNILSNGKFLNFQGQNQYKALFRLMVIFHCVSNNLYSYILFFQKKILICPIKNFYPNIPIISPCIL
ncbi:hypothetical protein GLOIN_2v1626087 [Rhizophagus irregularis DAOM 181602=DAOM 197198]|uniref:Uncharacterized protein n=1 Tax=Rhizophagus irregularis (strain DAOM 181602 / DAOM 197198 / MUCL 43194) TaxID=747089 RepID=A0A2P4PVV1_RHIID|nr:hypothetical protein GLOIN_2v1626087 [Rhizophagus irregularis DAOM 181602=DAOM 197198]POG69498.1 hypothetical protein GLOIN_2v1626087 [Rhizophagus irregularis DAOM 181602=DAOM 197198]GET52699.1 hypothetical protein GLOIN_2v1626087 [Rhizophagus irregularis DAOM 181602=DAOM 197198]|eukprot:XP_025176364.1 hypothetical protein GLOIN_2v1626087 [Rhizophagus irregularis DAOM 181602=DAOM 197198]